MDRRGVEAEIEAYLADPAIAWSLGSYGAIAEFLRTNDEASKPADARPLSRVTARGGIAVDPRTALLSVGYTTRSRHDSHGNTGIAFCLPVDECAMHGRALVTEIGPDDDALRGQDRDAIVFDMGLGQLQIDVCVRSADPAVIARLRRAVGRSVFDPDEPLMREMPLLGPHRVFLSRAGRIEVFQGIPPTYGRSPDGPHTHVLPDLLKERRTHAADIPIPAGLVPCLTAHLPAVQNDGND